MPSAIWEGAPAIVVPTPVIVFGDVEARCPHGSGDAAYSLLMIDREYVARELLPSLAERHSAITRRGEPAVSTSRSPSSAARRRTRRLSVDAVLRAALDAQADATADLFQVRTQDFLSLAAEVRRFTAFVSPQHGPPVLGGTARFSDGDDRGASAVDRDSAGPRDWHGRPPDVRRRQPGPRRALTASSTPRWKLVVTHPSGSLEAAVSSQRRRNLAISSSVLGLLGASMGLLVLATRRAQRLAKQQMEFVAAVSHELRTPLAVIRSAAENLADGVVHDEARIRRYGELMRTEGRRLTEMVEQILEFAGIQSGQRGFALRPVGVAPLLHDIVSASSGLIESAGLAVDFDIPADLPPVLGDEPALRRAFQNLIDNAVKYGAGGGSIRRQRPQVRLGSQRHRCRPWHRDRRRRIRLRIFEPFYRAADVVAAQMQGAGLGLSLVQRIVAAHGGRVTVKSAPREGSAFTVQLPAADERAAPERAPDHSSADASGGVQALRPS